MATTFNVEIVLKGRDFAVTEPVTLPHGQPSTWDDAAVRDALVGILRAIARAENPALGPDHLVALRGFSWIVEPVSTDGTQVVIAIEIPMGAAVAGPFTTSQADLDAKIGRVLRAERSASSATIH